LKRRTYFDAEPWYQREKTGDWYQQMEKTNEAFKELLEENLNKSHRVLEVACGGGWLAEYIMGLGVEYYAGFDFAETAVKNAAERLKRYNNVEIMRGDALDPSLYNGDYDFIVAHQFLHCLIGDDRKIWLNLCSDALGKNRGTFLLSSMIGLPESLGDNVNPVTRVNIPGNRYYAEDEGIRDELKSADFEIERIIYPENNSGIYLSKKILPLPGTVF